jgi:hypothetical protein
LAGQKIIHSYVAIVVGKVVVHAEGLEVDIVGVAGEEVLEKKEILDAMAMIVDIVVVVVFDLTYVLKLLHHLRM